MSTFDKTKLVLIKNITGTPGTNAENAIYGLSYFGDKAKVFYNVSGKDFRDKYAVIDKVTYEINDVVKYIKDGKWELLGTQR